MRIVITTAIAALLVLGPQNVHGRLGQEVESSNRNLARGGQKGPPARGGSTIVSPGQAKKDEAAEVTSDKVPPGEEKKAEGDDDKPSWVHNFEPVDIEEPTEVTDSPEFQEVLTSYKALLKHSNEKIKAEKEEHDAANVEDKAATDESDALKEEAGASNDAEKEAAHKKLVAARLAKQKARDYVKQAREKTRSLEATDQSLHAAFDENQEKYRVKLQEKALKAAQDTKDEVEKDKEEGKSQDKAVWRATREAGLEKIKKDKDELRKENIGYKTVCEQIVKAEERLSAARTVKVMRTEARLAKLEGMEMPVTVREVEVEDFEEQVDEDKIWAELSQAQAVGAKKECEAVTDSQMILFDRVFTVQEGIKERDLAKQEMKDAREKYMKELEEKKAADEAVADAAKEKATAETDTDKQAAQLRLQDLQEKAKSKAVLVAAASDKLRDAQAKRLEADLKMIRQAEANKDDEKKQAFTPEEGQAIMLLDEVIISQATDGSEDEKGAKAMEAGLESATATLKKKLEQQEAVYIQIDEEVTAAREMIEGSEGSAGDQAQRLVEVYEMKSAELLAAQLALEDTVNEQNMLQSDLEIVVQAKTEIPQAEVYEIDLVKISQIHEKEAQENADGDEDEDEQN